MSLRLRALRATSRPCLRCLYSTGPASTDVPAPPLLLKLRNELKSAMKQKDQNRLSVLRGVLADVTHSDKTNKPVKSDMQVLSLLRKRVAASKAAAVEFESAGRQDLKEQEDAQVNLLESYAGEVTIISEEEVRKTVEQLRGAMARGSGKVDKGQLLMKLIGPGGAFEGQNVEKSQVIKIVQEVLGGQSK